MNDVVSEYRLWSIIRGEPARLFTEEQRREAILNEKSGTIIFDSIRVLVGHNSYLRIPLSSDRVGIQSCESEGNLE